MSDFEPTPGFWGGDQITAADMARFFYRLDANLPGAAPRLREAAAGQDHAGASAGGSRRRSADGWSIWFKGGWRPPGGEHNSGPVTHQAALLVHRHGERLALAVLTDEAPWGGGGFEAIEGVRPPTARERPRHTAAAGLRPNR